MPFCSIDLHDYEVRHSYRSQRRKVVWRKDTKTVCWLYSFLLPCWRDAKKPQNEGKNRRSSSCPSIFSRYGDGGAWRRSGVRYCRICCRYLLSGSCPHLDSHHSFSYGRCCDRREKRRQYRKWEKYDWHF